MSSRFTAESEASPQHAALSRTAADFEDAARQRGWIRPAGSMETAMRWMGQLTGQASDSPADAATPVARYLDANGTTLDAPGFSARLLTDITLAWELTGAIDTAAAALIRSGGGASRAALSRSIGEAETASAQARDALALFDALIEEMPAPADSELADQLVAERDLLVVRADSLRERVDELVTLRRNSGSTDSLS